MKHRTGWPWSSARLAASPPWVGGAHRVAAVDRQWLIVAGAMTVWAAVFFGWRGLMQVAVATMACTAVHLIALLLRRPAAVGHAHAPTPSHSGGGGGGAVWLGMMTGLSLPLTQDYTLPLLAGLLTGGVMQVVGRSHRLRVHPLAVVMVAVWLVPLAGWWGGSGWLIQQATEPIDAVLRPSHVVRGDVFELVGGVSYEPWWETGAAGLPDGVRRASFVDSLWRYRYELATQRTWLVSMLSSGELPRFEELLLGSVPGPVGGTSPAVVIGLGVYLMYRRLAWWPMPLWALGGAVLMLAWMPVPGGAGAEGWSTVAQHLVQLGPAAGLTLLGYLLLASAAPLVVMIHAPLSMPLTPRGRAAYALVLGSVAMAAQWLIAVPQAPYLGLLVAGLLSRLLDNLHHSPFAR